MQQGMVVPYTYLLVKKHTPTVHAFSECVTCITHWPKYDLIVCYTTHNTVLKWKLHFFAFSYT